VKGVVTTAARAFCLLACLTALAVAETDDLVDRVIQRYSDLDEFYVAGTYTVVTTLMGMRQVFTAPFVQAGSAPGKVRLEIDHDKLGSLVVSDGEATWTYLKALEQYRKQSVVPIEGGAPEAVKETSLLATDGNFLDMYSSLALRFVTSRVVGEQEVESRGGKVACKVIEVVYTVQDTSGTKLGPDSVWVEPRDALVMKSVHHLSTTMAGEPATTRTEIRYDVIRMDEPPPDELFVFEPPPGASEVDNFGAWRASGRDLSGELAPDFRLSDLDGRPHRLANYRGKVVVLDFWASWCAPCRKELPAIDRIHREYGDRGLVVLAVNSESQKVAAEFMKKMGYSFTVLTDVDGSVFDEYAVSSIPVTIVVDRKGLVSAHFVGFEGEDALFAALRRAGLR
jgi:thiol-disulfide isomerase/thioredoxin/outer membrane lipoprotein-sorting protein